MHTILAGSRQMSGNDKWSSLMKVINCAWHAFGWVLIICAVVYMVFNFVTGRPLFREDGLSIGWLIAIMLTLFANQKLRNKRRKSRQDHLRKDITDQ